MSKLTKQQLVIYNWLLEHPGYLKKGSFALRGKLPIKGTITTKNLEKVLKQARIGSKLSKSKSSTKSLKDLEMRCEGPIMRKTYKLTDKVDFSKTPWGKKLKENEKIIALGKEVAKQSTWKIALPNKTYDFNNVLEIADLHLPFCKEGYLEHCIAMRDKYNCGQVVVIGDEVDLCGVSQWEKDPDGFSAGTEAALAQEQLKKWFEAFPEAFVCIGNHTARPFRQAKANGIPKKFIKSYEEAWEAPKGWKWADHWEINGVWYTHGTGFSGANAAIKIATRYQQNVVIGHIHSEAGIQYAANRASLVWGKQLGGALNDNSYAAYYAKDQLKKSIVGCGVTINGTLPIYEPMKL